MLDVEFAEITDRGRVREHNEDALGHVAPASAAEIQSRGWLFVLADGLGGHANGEVASKLAVDTMLAGFRRIPKGVMHVSLLPRLVQEANEAVFHDAAKDAGSAGMATTLVACALRFDSAVISHVGDSRCYLLRGGTAAQLTRDHTMAAEQLRLGLLSEAEASSADNRHVLTRCLGTERFVPADTVTVNLQPGDLLLLCSDGVHGYVPNDTIEQILDSSKDLTAAATALVEAANQAGGHDNASVQLIRVNTVERMGLYRGRPYRLL